MASRNSVAVDGLASVLAMLIARGLVAKSRTLGPTLKRLRPLIEAGALREVSSGPGKAFAVANVEAIKDFIRDNYPAGLLKCDREERSRKGNLEEQEDIIEFRLSGTKPLTIGNTEFIARGHRGVHMAVIGGPNPPPSFNGSIAIVASVTAFLRFDWSAAGFDMVVLTKGVISTALLRWLDAPGMQQAEITHVGDIDPSGLAGFMSVAGRMKREPRLYLPSDIESRLRDHGHESRLAKGLYLIPQLMTSDHPDIMKVLDIMRVHAKGIDHETLLLAA